MCHNQSTVTKLHSNYFKYSKVMARWDARVMINLPGCLRYWFEYLYFEDFVGRRNVDVCGGVLRLALITTVAVIWFCLPIAARPTTPKFSASFRYNEWPGQVEFLSELGHIVHHAVFMEFDGTTGILSSLTPIKNTEASPSRSPNQPILTGPCSRCDIPLVYSDS